MAGLKKEYSVVEELVSPDKAEFCCKVKLVRDAGKLVDGLLAIILHGDKNETESCLIFFEESSDISMPPIIVKTMSIYSDIKFDIAQSNLAESNKSDLLVTISTNQDSASLIFLEKDNMTEFLSHIKEQKAIAATKKHDSANNSSHQWVHRYKEYSQPKKPTRSNSLPMTDENPGSALRYVLPLQRAETIAKINLKRTRTVKAAKERKIKLEDAKIHWINNQLMKKEQEFVDWRKLNVFVGTWNVHGSSPEDANLKVWLKETLKADDGKLVDPDFYVIGLQEMETSTEAYVRYDPTKEKAWVKGVLNAVNSNGEMYYNVVSKQLVTMLLIVIAKKPHHQFISEVSSTYAGVGLMNMMGNKGGVAVRFRYLDSYLCFVTSHLAAYTEKVEKRNQDFTELSKRLFFPHKPDPITEYVSYFWNDGGDEGVSFLENQNIVKDWNHEASIFHNDFLIWCGDLNYRVNLNQAIIKSWIRQDKIDLLLDYDQLSIERQAGRTFPMFDEGSIKFVPTYKYDAGTDQYDTSEKRRAPSWTDRILWKKDRINSDRQSVELKSYSSCMDLKMSDHKPVRALFELNIRKIDTRYKAQYTGILEKQLQDNTDVQPRGEISSSYVEFEKVQFMEYKEKSILLENTGQVIAVFKFMPRENEPILPSYLQVSPLSGVLAPGEKVVIRFEITVDPTNSAPLNRGTQIIDDILILRLENCKDFFITVNGEYIPTCFGVPLEHLSEMPVPISETAARNLQRFKPNTTSPPSTPGPLLNQIEVPKELWKITNFLWNANMFCIESLFLEHGDLIVSTYIRKCLDNGVQFDTNILLGFQPSGSFENLDVDASLLSEEDKSVQEILSDSDRSKREAVSANSMIDVLVAFLECLPDPIIPTKLYERALEAGESSDAMKFLLETLPDYHRNILLYIAMFLRQAIDKSPASCKNNREAKIIETFTVLLRSPIDFKERNPVVAKEKREQFISKILKLIS